MLKVQEYLKTKTFEDLTAELGITVKKHDTLPLAILNYDQIESPKTHPIVRECRALTLHSETKEIVARSFARFFNWGEVAEEMPLFDFTNFNIQSKEDGSLVVIYFFDGLWHANTRGSFATDTMQNLTFTWREGICKALRITDLQELKNKLDPRFSYICEFCSPWNKVVRRYEKPVMYLLSMFEGHRELTLDEIRQQEYLLGLVECPIVYSFKSIEEIQAFLNEQGQKDPTFEGVVIRDCNNRRWKIKNATYLSLHKMRGEGDNLFNPKHLLPFVLAGEEAELLVYFPEVRQQFYELKAEVQGYYIDLLETWVQYKDIEDQKEFALTIKDKTPFASVLFTTRKLHGKEQKVADLKREWRNADGAILKKIKP